MTHRAESRADSVLVVVIAATVAVLALVASAAPRGSSSPSTVETTA